MTMTLDKLYKIRESLEELVPDAANIDFGPSLEMTKRRQQEALRLVNIEIKLIEDYEEL